MMTVIKSIIMMVGRYNAAAANDDNHHHHSDGVSGYSGGGIDNKPDDSKMHNTKDEDMDGDSHNCVILYLQNLQCTHSGPNICPWTTILIRQPHQMSIISLWLQLLPSYWTFTDASCL